ncbi:response regulator transcription factor [Aneurinibacillus terranovensis]|uniref:response regulator transcription factor n=1 Tax=Aneurinibacillus terranovensis TaxID=278991 RepID=UPI00040F7425|nr:response regulator transcription factor [Aneurinibacillus terranovensis]
MSRILVVEDEFPIARLLEVYLKNAGYSVFLASNGEDAIRAFQECKPDLVLLDLMLPDKEGWEILDVIRKQSSCPVIILTARGEVKDRLYGFKHGADDYIAKPFDPEEVVARVQAVLRRPIHLVESEQVQLGSLVIDFTARQALCGGQAVSITPRDWELLSFLARHPNQGFSREQLLDRVWGMDYEGGDRAVDVAIKRLRKCLRNWPAEEGEIVTLRGVGYMLRVV